MLKHIAIATLAALCLAAAQPAAAGPNVNDRQHHQGRRIKAGVGNGSMTAREAADATRDLARTQKRERAFRSDGQYTPGERVRTQRMLNRSSHQIYRYKHNGRNR